MLYKQGKYAAMKKHFETLKERLEAKEMFVIQSIYVLIFAASYKEVRFEKKLEKIWILKLIVFHIISYWYS